MSVTAVVQLRIVLGCLQQFILGMLECTGCLHAWLLFWADAELITAADDLCEVVIP